MPQVYNPSVMGACRLGATRLGFLKPQSFCLIGGVDHTADVRQGTTTITLNLNSTPGSAVFRVNGTYTPVVGQDCQIHFGTKRNILFGGVITLVSQVYEDTQANVAYDVTCQDYTWLLDRRPVFARYQNLAFETILANLISTFTSGFTTHHVVTGLGTIADITFAGIPVSQAISQLCTQSNIGARWFVDPTKDVWAFVARPSFDLQTITAGNLYALIADTDLTQVRTRVTIVGAATTVLSATLATETILPVALTSMFGAGAGSALVDSQVIAYTGVLPGGSGSLVGPGVTPSSAALLVIIVGTGLSGGLYTYAYTWVTAAGETLPSPLATITAGLLPPPSGAPALGAATVGGSLGTGVYQYAYSDVTAGGETVPSPLATVTTDVLPAPGSAPSGAATTGAGVDVGVHVWAATYVTASGETTASPLSAPVTAARVTLPLPLHGSFTQTGATTGSLTANSWYGYNVTYVDDLGNETSAAFTQSTGLLNDAIFLSIGNNRFLLTNIPVSPNANVTARKIYRTAQQGSFGAAQTASVALVLTIADNTTTSASDTIADVSRGAAIPGSNTATYPQCLIALTAIPIGPTGVTSRKLYRTAAGGSQLKLLATIADNTTTTYSDSVADASLGANVPVSNTAVRSSVAISAIAVGPTGVTSRKVYRTTVGGTQLRLLTTLADNTTTTYTDTTADGSLGAFPLTVGTAAADQVALSGIALGPATVTSRKVYRTVSGGSQLKLVTTISDNTTTTYTDSTADGALGANAPGSDTSALTQPAGQTLAGSSSLILAGAGAFSAGGGWALIGNQPAIRFTGITGNTLTGIPAVGPGAITVTIPYNTMVVAPAALTGVTGLTRALQSGAPIALYVQRNALAAQAALAVIEGGDGIHDVPIVDATIATIAQANTVGDAQLALFKLPESRAQYTTRDQATDLGKTVPFVIGAPTNVNFTELIQTITITGIDQQAGASAPPYTYPPRAVTASTTIYVLADLLRNLALR